MIVPGMPAKTSDETPTNLFTLRVEMAQLCTLLGLDWSRALSGKGAPLDQLHAPDQAPLPELTPEHLASLQQRRPPGGMIVDLLSMSQRRPNLGWSVP